jgi:type IV pilus assembly protein PilV
MIERPFHLPCRRSRGFTMIELLVSVLVLAIGLLGLAGLQAAGLKSNYSAHLRSQATLLAYDLADRMRANPVALADGKYNNPTASKNTACLASPGCKSDVMAGHDFYEWTTSVGRLLPGGKGTVCIDSTPTDGDDPTAPACDGSGENYAVKIWWNDERSGEPTLFQVSFKP